MINSPDELAAETIARLDREKCLEVAEELELVAKLIRQKLFVESFLPPVNRQFKDQLPSVPESGTLFDDKLPQAVSHQAGKPSGQGKSRRPKKVPRGFFLINLSGWEQDEMRQLSKECGTDLRTMITHKMHQIRYELKDKIKFTRLLGVNPSECWHYIGMNPRN